MKRTSFSILSVLMTLLTTGCGPFIPGSGQVTTATRQVSGFQQIDLFGSPDVILTQGESESLRIEAEDNLIPYLVTEVRGGTLEIGFRTADGLPLSVRPTQPVKVYVTMKTVTGLRVTGSGDLDAERLAADTLQLTVTGSGNLSVEALTVKKLNNRLTGSGDILIDELTAEVVETVITGSGNCSIAGESAQQSARISGSGDYRASELQSEQAAMQVTGSGNVNAWVTEKLSVEIVGSGNVKYYGLPTLTQRIVGSGDISALGVH